jgi:hypothetical protein
MVFREKLLETVAQLPLREVGKHPEGLGYACRSSYCSSGGVSTQSLDECGTKAAQVDILLHLERMCTVRTIRECDQS